MANQFSLFDKPEKTLRQARAEMLEKARNGTRCPCCFRFVKIYKRKFNSGMAMTLIWMVRHHQKTGTEWIDIPTIAPRHVVNSRELGKLEHWGMVVRAGNHDPAKKHSGIWRCTVRGVQFGRNESTVPKYSFLLHNKIQGFSEEKTTIIDALGSKFNYQELMSA
jgi:hypothetical protein